MAEKKDISGVYLKFLEAQKEIGVIKKDSNNPFFKSKYVDINGILAVVKPVLNKHGLVLTQALHTIEGRIGLLTAIVDAASSEKIESFCYLSEMSKPQETGSAITYYRRYALQSLLALEAEDDDGNAASGKTEEKTGWKKPVGYVPPPKNPNVEKFEEDMQVVPEDLILYQEKLEAALSIKDLQKAWLSLPPMAQEKLEKLKNDLKFKLA